jgi:cell division protein DivIC
MAGKKIVRLNNNFTTQQLKTMETSHTTAPKRRRYLGLILIAVILVMLLPTINLIKSYETLQSRQALKVKYEKKSTALDQQLAVKKSDVLKLKDPIFIEKYVRAKYGYSKDGEKVFSIPELVDGGITTLK